MGGNNARKLKQRHKENRWADKSFKKKHTKETKNADPLEGADFARGCVLEKMCVIPYFYNISREEAAHGENSGVRKGIRVKLLKNGKEVLAYCPLDGSVKVVDENDEVLICKRHGLGDNKLMKYELVKIHHVSLTRMRKLML